MRRSMAVFLAMLLGIVVSARAFTQPTAEQLEAAANDPTQMGSLLRGASKEKAAQVITAVIGEVEKLQIPFSQKQERVDAILTASRVDLGHNAEVVMAMVFPNIKAAFRPRQPPRPPHPPHPPHPQPPRPPVASEV